ncbi:S1/P1 nuclease-domain-containing protein [Entophlyctis helioformis]|nr:S1/P1 nuclease-domain-containing protein [Entophlyctis helioformis]
MFAPAVALLAVASAPSVMGWGFTAHQSIGLVAMNYLDDNAKTVLSKFLLSNETVSSVSTWADAVRSTPQYSWTAGLHFVNPKDAPPKTCNYDDDRDCKTGACIIGGVANYTARAVCGTNLPMQEQVDATKFIIHFISDITQPLHACGRSRGGNDEKLVFATKNSTNVHAIWDTDMPEKFLREEASIVDKTPAGYAAYLVNKLETEYKTKSASWISKHDILAVNQNGNSLAAIDWATDSNDFNCANVWPEYDADKLQDFSGKYYQNSIPIFNMQMAKAGFRLANWLNRVLGTCKPAVTTTTVAAVATTTTTTTTKAVVATTAGPVIATSTVTPAVYNPEAPVYSGAVRVSAGAAAAFAAIAAAFF